MKREIYDEDHEAFRSSVREFLERSVIPNVEQHAIEPRGGFIPLSHRCEAAATDRHARVAREHLFGMRDRVGILVHQQQPASRAESLQHAARVASAPEGAVQVRSVLFHLQPFHDLRVQHRQVQRWEVTGRRGLPLAVTRPHKRSSSMCALRSSSVRV